MKKNAASIRAFLFSARSTSNKVFVWYALTVFLLISPNFVEGCGKHPAQSRVVNGNEAPPHSWPWQVSIRYKDYGHICGGALITAQWVLTAAHCADYNEGPSSYTVVVGLHHLNGSQGSSVQKYLSVQKIYYHWFFRGWHSKYDIALLKLTKPVILTDKVNTVCLPKNSTEVKPGTECYITGWGRLKTNGTYADGLQQAKMRVVDHDTCANKNDNIGNLKVDEKTMFCAGGQDSSGCQGDSGGPFACKEKGKWVIRGVISWGHPDCLTDYYSVFTRVSSYLEWINNIMTKGKDCLDHYDNCADSVRYCFIPQVAEPCGETCQPCV